MICAYCGEFADTFDHVIPVSHKYVNRKLEVGNKEAVPCCRECNETLSNVFLHTISSRSDYLIKRYKKKYKKVLNTPNWESDELEEMGANMVRSILARMDMRDIVQERLQHLSDTKKVEYTIQECKDKFINLTYKPIHSVVFTKVVLGQERKHVVFASEVKSKRMLFENSFVEKAIDILESRGIITDDYTIEVIRASSS